MSACAKSTRPDERLREEPKAVDPEITPAGFAKPELLTSPPLRIHHLSEIETGHLRGGIDEIEQQRG
jgi:hypothetical protein